MSVVTVASFMQFQKKLTAGQKLKAGTVKVTYEITVPEESGGGGTGGTGGTGGGGSTAALDKATKVQQRLASVSRASLANKITQKIQTRKASKGLVNPFAVAVSKKEKPTLVHPWATTTTNTLAPGVTLPSTTTTTTTVTTVIHPVPTRSQASDAHFLIQATFGPTRATLAELSSKASLQEWVSEQIALPVESHREFYRERVNQRMTTGTYISAPRPACKKGSRWSGIVFGEMDPGKTISVTNGKIYIGGSFVSDIDPSYTGNSLAAPLPSCTDVAPSAWTWQGKDCVSWDWALKQNNCNRVRSDWVANKYCQQSCFNRGVAWDGDDCSVGWPNIGPYSGYICEVGFGIGEFVRLSTSSSCSGSFTAMLNPGVWLANPSAAEKTTLAFEVFKPGTIILAETPSTCTLTNILQSDLEVPGRAYLHESRMELVENTLQNPVGSSGHDPSIDCPTAPKTFMNEKFCKAGPSCTSLSMRKARFQLNASSLERLSAEAGRRVLVMRGLKPTVSPCGRFSRWRRVERGVGELRAHRASELLDADAAALGEALQKADDQGWLRDFEVTCLRVPAGAVVDDGHGELFEHMHNDEYSVFDFTEVETVVNWTAQGAELHFPQDGEMLDWDLSVGKWAARAGRLGKIGDMVDLETLGEQFARHRLFDIFSTEKQSTTFGLQCGSRGEVANKPMAGHFMAFWQNTGGDYTLKDFRFDHGPYGSHMQYVYYTTRGNVWASKALYAKDQLRQRMAWSLSQICTVAQFAGVADIMSEPWINFYDTFVRNAFGSYRDILREMTYSPIMANWLTYINNKAVDVDGLFPDENYAREIMQVFSIGLWKLNRDGTTVQDADGNDVRTYENWNILEFARVFTGFQKQSDRGNMEDSGRTGNLLDPMKMNPSWHDVYPKAHLDRGYLGDNYPLCRDLPPRSFLAAGARFSFKGGSNVEHDTLVLSSGTPLFTKLCGAASAPCSFMGTIELDTALLCQGSECSATNPKVFQVADGFYEFEEPVCVYPFYWDTGRWAKLMTTNAGHWDSSVRMRCLEPTATKAAGANCCKGCSDNPNPWITNNGFTCANVGNVHGWLLGARCKHTAHWVQALYCMKSCAAAGAGYDGWNCSEGDWASKHACAYQREKMTYPEAEDRCASNGMNVCQRRTGHTSCGYDWDLMWTPHACTVKIIVHFDGQVSVDWDDMSKKLKFPVQWGSAGFPVQDDAGACPTGCTADGSTACSCSASATEIAVFSELPASGAAVASRLKVGAFPPTAPCVFGCGGEVEAYSANGIWDKDTILKSGGHFYKNVDLKVELQGYEFRNPPTFTLRANSKSKKALDEVEALLDHLFYHENTPTFISYRLIQHLTESNPSPAYVYEVQAAFRTGIFNGTTYSGKYGDLGATAAAILLHPQARARGAAVGALRAPLLKILHFMRSMEYKDIRDREVQFGNLQGAISQWPFSAPDVFSFFHPEFHPEGFPAGMVGPEFQIFTMPDVMAYINLMHSLRRNGVAGGGMGLGGLNGGKNGDFLFAEASSKAQTITDMDVLLTGGRLGSDATAFLSSQYDAASSGQGLQALQDTIYHTPAFATLGDSLLPTTISPVPAPAPKPPARDYKALVLVFLNGGVDSFQVLVPTGCTLYDEYRTIRESIALTTQQLLGITTTGQACSTFGLHPNLPFLQSIYTSGEAAFVANIGGLVEPLTAKTFRKDGRRCNGLFSHKDQAMSAQTLTCQVNQPIYKGLGGRLADALASGPHAYTTESFSMHGRARWSLGFTTSPKIVSRSSGNVPLQNSAAVTKILDNITAVKHVNIYCEEYRKQLKDAVDTNEELGTTLSGASLSTSFSTSNKLSSQLKQVARLISARDARKAERDLFFVSYGHFDHHQNVVSGLSDLLSGVNSALQVFVTELKAQGVFDKVVMVSTSDFGRTLAPNSNAGTDHGWAGHHFVIGGAVNGGKVYNRYPQTLLPGHSMDIHHGRIIPEFPWENIFVPIAEWMGMEASQSVGVFPNINNFNATQHFLPRSTVFST